MLRSLILVVLCWMGAWASAAPTPPTAAATRPPRNVPLVERPWAELLDHTMSETGARALAIKPGQWRQAETENFVLHFRRVRDANAVAREIEFDLWFVAKELGARREQYARKSHVFIFQDEAEWQRFLSASTMPAWAHSFARGDELFLDVRGESGAFDAENVAHETTHAVIARLYGSRHWPVWLNEGFAEYMGRASVAAQHSQSIRRNQVALGGARLTIEQLTALQVYPTGPQQVAQLYETAEKFVRYLANRYPKPLFPQFVERVLAGEAPPAALVGVYGSEFRDMAGFERKFARFTR